MEQYIGCDSHRRYSVFVVMNERGQASAPIRVKHDRGEIRHFLSGLPVGSQIAIESTGGWYWLVDEMEAAGLKPQLANAHEAKQRMAGRNKTDKLDARGLAMELLMGTLPSVWIPPAELRDLRALMRTRLALRAQSTQVKNRVSAAVNRYGLKEPQQDGDLAFFFESVAVAFDVDGVRVMEQAVQHRCGQGIVMENLAPLAITFVRGQHIGAVLIALADDLKKAGGRKGIDGQVSDLVDKCSAEHLSINVK